MGQGLPRADSGARVTAGRYREREGVVPLAADCRFLAALSGA
jgi:hypothetical protein